MIYQIVLTLLSCGYMAISSTYSEDTAGIFIEEMVFGASVLLDLLLRSYASDRRWVVTEQYRACRGEVESIAHRSMPVVCATPTTPYIHHTAGGISWSFKP